jgi:amidase
VPIFKKLCLEFADWFCLFALPVPLGFQPDNVIATTANPTISNAPGVPFGLSFTGTAFSEFKLISYAFAYEQATHNRLKRLAFKEAIPKTQLKDVMGK